MLPEPTAPRQIRRLVENGCLQRSRASALGKMEEKNRALVFTVVYEFWRFPAPTRTCRTTICPTNTSPDLRSISLPRVGFERMMSAIRSRM